jgi:3-phenylpropionate/cinnamic acid dioxygenase small subunit
MTVDRRLAVDFVHHESRLLDDGDLDGWLDLFAEECRYWVPAERGNHDPDREVSIVYDDRPRLKARVVRLTSGKEYAQDPPSVTCHQLSNIMVNGADDEIIEVDAVQVVYETRPNTGLQIVPGRVRWLLRRRGDGAGLEIIEKRIDLVEIHRYFPNLTFIL